MRVLVTGSEGSLMQWTIPHLLEAGHEVVGVDNFGRYGRVERDRDYEFVEGDLCDPDVVEKVTEGVDLVIQAAARIYGVKGFHEYGADILSYDVELHNNLVRAARDRGMDRIVYISSSMVYERSQEVPTSEDDVAEMKIPNTDYGLSKLVCERLCRAFQEQYGLDYTIWRPFNIVTPYEEGEDEPGMSHVFADFIRKLLEERQNPMEIFGDGEQIRCFTWVDDVARGIAVHSTEDRTRNEIYNLGNPSPTTMKELARLIFTKGQDRGVTPEDETLSFDHRPIYDDDVRKRIPDVSKAKRELGWEPTVGLDEALDRCVDEALQRLDRDKRPA